MANTQTESKQRLWVVTELYYPEMTSTGYYLTKIAEGLAGDFDVRVICGQPNYSARGITAPKSEIRKGVGIRRVFGTRLDKNIIPFRVINMITLGASVLLKCIFSIRRGDRVLVVTTPPLMPFLTAIACWLKKAKHILLIHDCYPEILYAAGKLKPGSPTGRLLEWLSKKLLVSADRLILVGRDMKERISGKTGDAVRSYVVPNWAELDSVSPAPRETNALIAELGLQDKLLFLYAGNMGYPNDIETFIRVAERLSTESPEIHFVFLGAGVKRPLLEEATKYKKLNNLTLLDSRPRSEQQDFLNACDIGIVSLVSRMWGVSMPSRTYNILAAGKPILAICEPGSEIDLVVREEEAGWTVEPGNEDALIGMIGEINRSRSALVSTGQNARSAAVEKYSLETAIEGYRKALRA